MTIRDDGYYPTTDVDPFPAYPHDIELVRTTLHRVMEIWPAESDLVVSVADREEPERSNAHSTYETYYEDEEFTGYTGHIFFSGKRIPPHPAMTRHLVGHEYGHNVEWWLERRNPECKTGCGCVIKDYAKVRGFDLGVHRGNGGRWHNSLSEIFACDFRILMCGLEAEYWPHGNIARPEDVPDLLDWWTNKC